MKLKQKLLMFFAMALPALAFVAYMALAPARVSASSCPPGSMYAGYNCPNGGCNSGTGYCNQNGSTNGLYIFCNPQFGHQPPGPGKCTNGCVTCTYGVY